MLSKLLELSASTGAALHLLVIAAPRFEKTEDFCGQNEVSTCFSPALSGGALVRMAGRCQWVAVPSVGIGRLLD
jgi:hypothetical protein